MSRKETITFAFVVVMVLALIVAPALEIKHRYRAHHRSVSMIILPKVPGVIDESVTESNVQSTVCVGGYTRNVRPPTSYTTKLKIQQLHDLGYFDQDPTHYEEDHLISLSLGGHPTDPNNLWPEPWSQAHASDPYEFILYTNLCLGSITLKQAQERIRHYKLTRG
jgi:hypothetical protein